jgi:copper chaperone
MSQKTLEVEGLSCGHCKKAVETALEDLAGVKKAEVDLEAANIDIDYDGVAEEDLIAAIEDAGPYQVQ